MTRSMVEILGSNGFSQPKFGIVLSPPSATEIPTSISKKPMQDMPLFSPLDFQPSILQDES